MPAGPAAKVDQRTRCGEPARQSLGVGIKEGMAAEIVLLLRREPGRLRVLPERGIHALGKPPGGRDSIEAHAALRSASRGCGEDAPGPGGEVNTMQGPRFHPQHLMRPDLVEYGGLDEQLPD